MAKVQQPRKNNGKARNKTPKRKQQESLKFRQAYGVSKLESDFAHEFLDKLGLHYVYEYEAKDIRRFYDFAIVALPEGEDVLYEEKHGVKCVDFLRNNCRILFLLELDGSFFHSDPRVVDQSKLTPMQKRNKFVDKLKNEWCVKHKIPLLRIWEYDVRKNPSLVMKVLEEMLGKLSRRERIKAGLNRPHPRKT